MLQETHVFEMVSINMSLNKHSMDFAKIISVYDHEISQSQTEDNPMVQRGRATQQSQDTRKTN